MSRDADTVLAGGGGYIGSHVVVELLAEGRRPVIFDDFSNANVDVIDRIERISGTRPLVESGDIRDRETLRHVFGRYRPEAVIHCAGRKSVNESVRDPVSYLSVNVGGSLALLEHWSDSDSECFIFSSSCTVYGSPDALPVDEKTPVRPVSPYVWSKLMVDQMMTEIGRVASDRSLVSLRYFNPVGAHESGLIGEDPTGERTTLMPLLLDATTGIRPHLAIFGTDYPTPDGTAIRDYIHVVDVASAHVAALDHLPRDSGNVILNLGRGSGVSVLQLIRAFENATGQTVPTRQSPRRCGDVPEVWCNPAAAIAALDWRAERDLEQACRDAWHYTQRRL